MANTLRPGLGGSRTSLIGHEELEGVLRVVALSHAEAG